MALDLNAVARLVGGTYREEQQPATTLVDAIVPIEQLVVTANPAFATLVTGSTASLLRTLHSGSSTLSTLKNAVFVTHEETDELSELLGKNHINAITGATSEGALLHSRLEALLLSDQAAEDRLVTSGMKVLTQVARRGGTLAVVVELAHRIDGWAVLLDASGQEITSAGAGRLHIQDAAAVAFNKPIRVRHRGLQVHPVGSDTDLLGYLVIASRSSSTSRNRDLASQAAALLDLILRTHDYSTTERLGRDVLIDTLITGGEASSTLLRRWGIHDSSLTGFALGARTRSIELERLVLRWLDEIGATHVLSMKRDRLIGFIRNDLADELADRVEQFSVGDMPALNLGLGTPVSVSSLARTASEARQAEEMATVSGKAVVRYKALPTVSFILDQIEQQDSSQLTSVLDPLRTKEGKHGDLTETLKAFLLENGGWRSTAARLNIHRQTLSNRVQRIEELTGLSLDSPDDRASAWLALRALERE